MELSTTCCEVDLTPSSGGPTSGKGVGLLEKAVGMHPA
jgi:hypothetical protein